MRSYWTMTYDQALATPGFGIKTWQRGKRLLPVMGDNTDAWTWAVITDAGDPEVAIVAGYITERRPRQEYRVFDHNGTYCSGFPGSPVPVTPEEALLFLAEIREDWEEAH